MKKYPKIILTVLLLFLWNIMCFAQSYTGPYVPVQENGKWGYIDQSGNITIKPRFDEAADFSDGWAKVKTGDKVSFINEDGEIVLTPDVSSVTSFSEGLAVASKPGNKKLGYINKKGKFVIEPRFLQAYTFSEGKAAVSTKKKTGFGYIDKQGKAVIKPQFDGARKFVDGLAPAQTGGFVFGRWGYIDTKGAFVIKPTYEDALPFSEGLAAVNTAKESGGIDESTWGYIDKKGNMAIKPHFYYGRSFSGGLAPVKDPSGWKFVDTKGEFVFRRLGNKLIDFADPFQGKLARVTTKYYMSRGSRGGTVTYDGTAKKWAYVDKTGNKMWPKAKVAAAPKLENMPDGFKIFNANWSGFYIAMAYPKEWTATNLNKFASYMHMASFVKNKEASRQLFKNKQTTIDTQENLRLISDDNIIINVAVFPGGGSDNTPEYVVKNMSGSAVKNPQKEPVKTYTHQNSPVAFRRIDGTDADGKKLHAIQLVTKRWKHIIAVFAYMPPGSEKSTQDIVSNMLDSMKGVDK